PDGLSSLWPGAVADGLSSLGPGAASELPGVASAENWSTVWPAAAAASARLRKATGTSIELEVTSSSPCLLCAANAVHKPNFAGPVASGPTASLASESSPASVASVASSASVVVDASVVVAASVLAVASVVVAPSSSSSCLATLSRATSDTCWAVTSLALSDANGDGTVPVAAAAAPAETKVTAPIVAMAFVVSSFFSIGRLLELDEPAIGVTTPPWNAVTAASIPRSSAGSAGARREWKTASSPATEAACPRVVPDKSCSASSSEIGVFVTSY